MNFRFVIALFILLMQFILSASPAMAIVNPLSTPNNRFGVHILEVDEVFQASQLVNSSGGKWGYVTIPIRTDERDKEKWSRFFQHCRENSIIPILRLATYADKTRWATPTGLDLIDFANFLNELPWPTKNRYIILFNEPNHSKEWGGYVSPKEYANLLVQARDIFKARSDDFFLISGGLDMSAPSNITSEDALRYFREMTRTSPKWYQSIDGIGVHAYPNPAFSSSPKSKTRYGITSYRYELDQLKRLGFSGKPVFITETGYIGRKDFYPTAFKEVWIEKDIVAITPFLLFAGAGEFAPFSLLNSAHQPTDSYMDIFNLPKIAGSPLLNPKFEPAGSTPALSFSSGSEIRSSSPNFFTRIWEFIFRLPKPKTIAINDRIFGVEIADTPSKRTRGLSGRENLAADTGLLFIFDSNARQTFWMKDMNFALDFLWINNGRIIQINENVPPPKLTANRPAYISSHEPVNWVLEVNAGFVKKFNIKVGDTVVLNSR